MKRPSVPNTAASPRRPIARSAASASVEHCERHGAEEPGKAFEQTADSASRIMVRRPRFGACSSPARINS